MTKELRVGQRASLTRSFDLETVQAYADLLGDHNPVHVDAEYARRTQFGRAIAHGFLTAGLFSTLLGTELPGPGSIYLAQSLQFLLPVYVDEEVTATVEVTLIRQDKPIVTLRTTAVTEGGLAVSGEAVVRV